jgi:hypothetical protein
VQAVAARAGLITQPFNLDYGVDGTFRAVVKGKNGRMCPSGTGLDFQLKSTVNWWYEGEQVAYDLEAITYNDLVGRDRGIDFILVLFCMPKDETHWLALTESELVLRHCCYWFRPTGAPTPNPSSVRIRFPRANLLTPESLLALMSEARQQDLRL